MCSLGKTLLAFALLHSVLQVQICLLHHVFLDFLRLHSRLNVQNTKIMASGLITSWQIDGETMETVETLFFWAPKSLQMVIAVMKLKDAYSLKEKL